MARLAVVLAFTLLMGCGNDGEVGSNPAGENPDDGSRSPVPVTATAPRTATAARTSTPGSVPTRSNTPTVIEAPPATPTRPPSVILRGVPAVGNPGQRVHLVVQLDVSNRSVAGTQNDLEFGDRPLRIAAKANGKPDCAVNPAIDKAATSFAFRPPGCTGDACTGVRALVLSTDNTDAVPDESSLYTCNVDIAADAEPENYAIDITGVIVSDPNGVRIGDAAGAVGLVFVRVGPLPTPAPNGIACDLPTDCESVNCVNGACCNNRDCGFNQSCNVSGHEGSCTAQGMAGDNCGRQGDCAPGLECQPDGVCAAPKLADGAYCRTDRECDSGYCVGNVCCNSRCPEGEVCVLHGQIGQCALPPTASATPTRTPTQSPFTAELQAEILEVDGAEQTVTVGIRLKTDAGVAGVQNDLRVDAPAYFLTRPGGEPDCAVSPLIDKPGTAFRCLRDDCTVVRAVVIALDNVEPIVSGSSLYTCRIGTAGSSGPLEIDNAIASSPNGQRLTTTTHGITLTPVEPVRLFAANAYVDSNTLEGRLTVFLDTRGNEIAGTQNDLRLVGPDAAVLRKSNGKPDCSVNPSIDKAATSFAFRPAGCAAGECTGIRALVLSTDNTLPIPNGSELYTCRITGTQWASIFVDSVIVSSPAGAKVPAIGLNSSTLFGGPTPTP